jgi:hypothetical protein
MTTRQAVMCAVHVLLDKEPKVSREDQIMAATELMSSLQRADERRQAEREIEEKLEGVFAQAMAERSAQA